MTDVKQFKLIGGEEVVCDLVDIQIDEYDVEVMIIRAAHSLISHVDFENGLRYYTFRPFMMHIHDPAHVLLLNSGSIICATNPSKTVLDEYVKHVDRIRKEEREKNPEMFSEEEEEDPIDDEKVIKFNPKLH